MSKYKIEIGDVLKKCMEIEDNYFHGVFSDPPYALKFMGNKWDVEIPSVETWVELLRVCKPGAYLLAFGGTRTHHRLMCNIEDAGWIIRDCLNWLYSSGFPKSHSISKALDKQAGAKRKIVGTKLGLPGYSLAENKADRQRYGQFTDAKSECVITAPTTLEARQWFGYGSALKPAWEPIILAQKPLDGTYAHNVLEHGCGGLNIDGCRIGYQSDADKAAAIPQGMATSKQLAGDGGLGAGHREGLRAEFVPTEQKGRWPANLLLSHHEECECVGTKRVKGSGTSKTFHDSYNGKSNTGLLRGVSHPGNQHANPDGKETVEDWRCHPDCPVAMFPRGRSAGNYPSDSSTENRIYGKRKGRQGALYSDSGSVARFFYCSKASRKERGKNNDHPTIKPLKLCEYLAKLILPAIKHGRLIVPYAGSGSEMISAFKAGWKQVIGIELEQKYIKIAQQRLEEYIRTQLHPRPIIRYPR